MSETTDMGTRHILLVEDHPLFRAMLAQLIEKEIGLSVCCETDNVADALSILETKLPDLAIVDLTLQGASGLDLLKSLKTRGIPVPVLVISTHEERLYAERVLRAGGRGFVSKQAAPQEVVNAIRKVLGGDIYISDALNVAILERYGTNAGALPDEGVETLSDRELEVFRAIGQGLNAREIAAQFNLGLSTVDSYRARIKEKLGLRNAPALSRRAAQWVFDHKD